MTDLTPFQILCEAKATELLQSYGRQFEERKLEGVSEVFISGRISGTDVTIYIYEDEVQLMNHRVDVRFENPDYDTDEEMVVAFLERLTRYLEDQAE